MAFKGHRAARHPESLAAMSIIAASLLACVIVTYGGMRLMAELIYIRHLPQVQNCALIAEMRRYAPKTKWMFSQGTIYPFYVNLPVIPELAVVSNKRVWSGQLSDQQMWAIVERYNPEQLLWRGALPPAGKTFVESHYSLVYDNQDQERLYVAKRILQQYHPQ